MREQGWRFWVGGKGERIQDRGRPRAGPAGPSQGHVRLDSRWELNLSGSRPPQQDCADSLRQPANIPHSVSFLKPPSNILPDL
ncbi:hypothetical protein SKAU_G00106560 [Synaphobranchus kaupii]|uniref:Uncharacterized protein n=1 Tax=Synaphobranchus kaupii TaxID=118154 RepID=A0A9Q1FZE9_SYNKA|nr:hypothetical protein SKAU_G00106560 [Synaphobranchus kaupii]